MKYYLIDDCTSSRSASWTEEISAASFEEAYEMASYKWSTLTRHDRQDRDSFLLGEVDDTSSLEVADGEDAGNFFNKRTAEFVGKEVE